MQLHSGPSGPAARPHLASPPSPLWALSGLVPAPSEPHGAVRCGDPVATGGLLCGELGSGLPPNPPSTESKAPWI
eukprot:15464243-Alexandrium_andersonii.AAC.1